MAEPELEARARLEDGVVEAPLTGGGENGITEDQVRTKSSMTIPLPVISL